MVFIRSDEQYTPWEPRFDADGTAWLKIYAHGTLTAKQPYKVIVNEYGYVTAALADDTTAHHYCVGVPPHAIADGAEDWIQIGGRCSGMIVSSITASVGHGMQLTGGVVADTANGDYTGLEGEFAVVYTDTTGADDVLDVMLIPREIQGQT